MFKVVLVFSLVMWALVIAIIVSSPSDMRRTVQLLRGTRGTTTPRFHQSHDLRWLVPELDLSARRASGRLPGWSSAARHAQRTGWGTRPRSVWKASCPNVSRPSPGVSRPAPPSRPRRA